MSPFTPNPAHLDDIARDLPKHRAAIQELIDRTAGDPAKLTSGDRTKMKDMASQIDAHATFLQKVSEMLRSA